MYGQQPPSQHSSLLGPPSSGSAIPAQPAQTKNSAARTSVPRISRLLTLALALCQALAPATARALDTCAVTQRPAATLLIPYFEVDLEDSEGATTLFSVVNTSEMPVAAHVVLWTDWSIPTFAWDVYLEAGAVQSYNLRPIFLSGEIPQTAGEGVPGCEVPVPTLPLGGDFLGMLQAWHSGQPEPGDELCYSQPRDNDALVTGYVTVDVVKSCSPGLVLPNEPGYFGEEGVLAKDNVLWGDVFYINPREDFAQGEMAVPLVASEEATGNEGFYSRLDLSNTSGRHALPGRYRTRFLSGGAFDGGTELLVWTDTRGSARPRDCSQANFVTDCRFLQVQLFDEAGNSLGEESFAPRLRGLMQLKVGSDELPATSNAGFLQLRSAEVEACNILPTGFIPDVQAWVMPRMSARGRFSIGMRPTVVAPTCPSQSAQP